MKKRSVKNTDFTKVNVKEDFYQDHLNDNVYLNVVMTHNQTSGNAPSIARYDTTKTLPVLEKASDYYCAIIRFTVPLNSVPLFIMPVTPGSGGGGGPGTTQTTPLIIGVTDAGGVDHPVNLIYTPENRFPAPDQNDINRQIITPYYYVYSYQTMIAMANTALATAYAAAGGAAPVPFFTFSPITQLITFLYGNSLASSAPGTPKIFFNEQFGHFFDAFRNIFFGYNTVGGHDYELVLTGNTADKLAQIPSYVSAIEPQQEYYSLTQDYSVLPYWNSLRKVFFVSNSIPVVNEFEPGFNTTNNQQTNVSTSQPILTDFVPPLELAGQTRAIAYFVPSSQYRLIDLINDGPLTKIDIQVFWQDKDGNSYPIFVGLFHQIEIKLGFFRKTLYKGTNLLLHK